MYNARSPETTWTIATGGLCFFILMRNAGLLHRFISLAYGPLVCFSLELKLVLDSGGFQECYKSRKAHVLTVQKTLTGTPVLQRCSVSVMRVFTHDSFTQALHIVSLCKRRFDPGEQPAFVQQ